MTRRAATTGALEDGVIHDCTQTLCPTCGCCSIGRMGTCVGGCGPRGGRSKHDRAGAMETQEARKTDLAGVRSDSRTGSGLESHLLTSMRLSGLPEPEREYRFHPTRKWRLDFAFVEQRLAVEVEGGVYRGGGHTSVAGIKRDIEKSNALTMAGWRLLRFHGDQVKSGEAVALIRQALEV